ncbi:MAG: hypothetical protein HYT62_00385 [Candidatus Yanofskybacteria bacterium]|nr:hypothetical protein [Candidatus Yanofskybacteria bacterium]
MNKELLEAGADTQTNSKERSYQRYLEIGGIINETDYNSALSRLKEAETRGEMPDNSSMAQAQTIADVADIDLNGQNGQIARLYSILRNDIRPEKQKYHHSDMSDHRIFREALRMLEDVDALDKLKSTYHTNRRLGTYCPLCGQIEISEDCP